MRYWFFESLDSINKDKASSSERVFSSFICNNFLYVDGCDGLPDVMSCRTCAASNFPSAHKLIWVAKANSSLVLLSRMSFVFLRVVLSLDSLKVIEGQPPMLLFDHFLEGTYSGFSAKRTNLLNHSSNFIKNLSSARLTSCHLILIFCTRLRTVNFFSSVNVKIFFNLWDIFFSSLT